MIVGYVRCEKRMSVRITVMICLCLTSTGCQSPVTDEGAPVKSSTKSTSNSEVVATVLGKDLLRTDLDWDSTDQLISAILVPLLEQYRQQAGITATDAEIQELRGSMFSDEDDSAEDEILSQLIYEPLILNWKVSKALYEQYGGTVIFQQSNPFEPVGAYRAFLEEHQRNGSFEILDPEYRKRFWDYFIRDHGHWVVPSEEVDYSAPWWLKGEQKVSG